MNYKYINNEDDLVKICADNLLNNSYIAVDTEFVRRNTYWPVLSLVQIATRDVIYIFDAQEISDLSSLWRVIYSPDIVKIIHAPHQDLEILVHLNGALPKNVFDTQTAALFTGLRDNIGYQALVDTLLGKQVDKSEQFTDWTKRPLTQNQLDYAARDVAHLIEVHDQLKKQLKKQNRYSWFEEEMHNYLSIGRFTTEPKEAWKKLRLAPWKAVHQPMLAGLAEWREKTAIERNVAKSRIIKDMELGKIAKYACPPEKLPEKFPTIWRKLEGMNLTNGFLEAYMDTLEQSKNLPEQNSLEPLSCLSQEQLRHYEFLKIVLSALSRELQLPSWLLAEKQELENYVRSSDVEQSGEQSKVREGWRNQAVWQVMQNASQGKAGISLQGGEPLLIQAKSHEDIRICRKICDFFQKMLGKSSKLV